jgi:DNA-binding YbaB/EbfC family protein
MIKGLNGIIKQAQKMKVKMEELQKELSEMKVEASTGGGMVTVVANGRQEILEIKIESEVVNPGDVEMLEDLIVGAVNQALKKSQDLATEEMAKLTGGLKIPGLNLA